MDKTDSVFVCLKAYLDNKGGYTKTNHLSGESVEWTTERWLSINLMQMQMHYITSAAALFD